jgi:hypothetical protein
VSHRCTVCRCLACAQSICFDLLAPPSGLCFGLRFQGCSCCFCSWYIFEASVGATVLSSWPLALELQSWRVCCRAPASCDERNGVACEILGCHLACPSACTLQLRRAAPGSQLKYTCSSHTKSCTSHKTSTSTQYEQATHRKWNSQSGGSLAASESTATATSSTILIASYSAFICSGDISAPVTSGWMRA